EAVVTRAGGGSGTEPADAWSLSHPYGWRARLGLIVPPTNTVNEAEWRIMAPEGVTIHSARMPLHTETDSDAGQAALYHDLGRARAGGRDGGGARRGPARARRAPDLPRHALSRSSHRPRARLLRPVPDRHRDGTRPRLRRHRPRRLSQHRPAADGGGLSTGQVGGPAGGGRDRHQLHGFRHARRHP